MSELEFINGRLLDFPVALECINYEFIHSKGRRISLQNRFPVFCVDDQGLAYLCLDNQQVVSLVMVKFFQVGTLELNGAMLGTVWTHPSYRGRGISSYLIRKVMIDLEVRNIDFSVLWTKKFSFYKKLGWKLIDEGLLGKLSGRGKSASDSILKKVNADFALNIYNHFKGSGILRKPLDFLTIPIPAESTEFFVHTGSSIEKSCYAIVGRKGTEGFLYEVYGDSAAFNALLGQILNSYSIIWLNTHHQCSFYVWSRDNLQVSFELNPLTMWNVISEKAKRLDIENNFYIPYLDRI